MVLSNMFLHGNKKQLTTITIAKCMAKNHVKTCSRHLQGIRRQSD